jgi:hypothetical protein
MISVNNKMELLPFQREKIEIIKNHIKRRKNLHIYGHEGSGKSVLLDWIYDNWDDAGGTFIPIYCRSSRTLREILLRITGFLLNHFKNLKSIDKFKDVKEIRYPSDLKKFNIRALKNIIFACIQKDRFCIILDHLEYITPKINSFLTALYGKTAVVSSSRESWELTDYNFGGKLNYCLYLIPKLSIENLKRNDAFSLMERLYGDMNMDSSMKQQIFKDVFCITKGNPKMIKEILEKAKNPDYFKDDKLNLKLIMIDCRINNIRFPASKISSIPNSR